MKLTGYALVLALVTTLASHGVAAEPTSIAAVALPERVYVMRHLEKGEGEDPPLSAQGAAQAQRLADLLSGTGIKAVFATPTRRAQQTGAGLASKLGLSVTPYDHKDVEALAKAVAAAGGDVLIVGHSNTVPGLVARFGGPPPTPLSESDYGAIFVVAPASKQVTVMSLPGN